MCIDENTAYEESIRRLIKMNFFLFSTGLVYDHIRQLQIKAI